MNKNPTIPDTWGIPDDQANKVIEALSKNSIRPEDRLQQAIEESARDIAIIEPDPEDWGWCVNNLLEQMGKEAERHGKGKDFERMVRLLGKHLDKQTFGGHSLST